MKEFQLEKGTGFECEDDAGTLRALKNVPDTMICSVVRISARTEGELANLVRLAQESQSVALFFQDEAFNKFLQYAKSVSKRANDKTEIKRYWANEFHSVSNLW